MGVQLCVKLVEVASTVPVAGHGNRNAEKYPAVNACATSVAMCCVFHPTMLKSTVAYHPHHVTPHNDPDMDVVDPDPTCGWQDQIL
tara:strand:+ start:70 stop:327 length:258 start_codon:yes stop_codon:yes gene_type:complete